MCVSVFQSLFLVIVIMIDGSENAIVKAFNELQSSHVCEKRSNGSPNNPFNEMYKLIVRGFCVSWVEVFENTCTNRNLDNELRRLLDRNRMLLEMVFQAFLDASCHRKMTLYHITTFT